MKLLITFLLLSSVCFGQSKKEQIEILTNRVDSLNTVLSTTRDNASKDIESRDATIDGLNSEIAQLKSDVSSLKSAETKLEVEIEKLTTSLEDLTKNNERLKNEIAKRNEENNIDIAVKTFKIIEGDNTGEIVGIPIVKIKSNPQLEQAINEEIFLRFNLLQEGFECDPVLGFESEVNTVNSDMRRVTRSDYFFSYNIFKDVNNYGHLIVEFWDSNFNIIRYNLSIDDNDFDLYFDRKFLDDPNREH